MKALIVEDDFTSRLLLQRFLQPLGEVHVAVNGREAVEAFRKARETGDPYDLVLLDIMMPEMDGQTALRALRGIEQEEGIVSSDGAKIVMTTALGDVKNVSTAYNSLCDGYLVKPIDRAKLLAQIESLGVTS